MSLSTKIFPLLASLILSSAIAAPDDQPDANASEEPAPQKPGDQVSGYAPLEPILENLAYRAVLTSAELESLSLNDLKLRVAYVWLLGGSGGPRMANRSSSVLHATLNDLKRRGDSATPLLLDIMDKNRNTNLEHLIPLSIAENGTIKIEPYLVYLRGMIRTRPDEINGSAFEAATNIFFDHGTPEDIQMMKNLATRRPYLAESLEAALQHQKYKIPLVETLPNPEDSRRIPTMLAGNPSSRGGNSPQAVAGQSPAASGPVVAAAGQASQTGGSWWPWAVGAAALATLALIRHLQPRTRDKGVRNLGG